MGATAVDRALGFLRDRAMKAGPGAELGLIATIAADAGMSVAAIKRAIAALQQEGVLEKTPLRSVRVAGGRVNAPVVVWILPTENGHQVPGVLAGLHGANAKIGASGGGGDSGAAPASLPGGGRYLIHVEFASSLEEEEAAFKRRPGVAGFLWSPRLERANCSFLRDIPAPVVCVGRRPRASQSLMLLASDNAKIGITAIDWLVEAGHQRIYILAEDYRESTLDDRIRAAVSRLAELHQRRGIEAHPEAGTVLRSGFRGRAGGEEMMSRLLERGAAAIADARGRIGIYAAWDAVAIGALVKLRELAPHLHLGRDVNIVSVDGSDAAVAAGIASLRQDFVAMGSTALRHLDRRITREESWEGGASYVSFAAPPPPQPLWERPASLELGVHAGGRLIGAVLPLAPELGSTTYWNAILCGIDRRCRERGLRLAVELVCDTRGELEAVERLRARARGLIIAPHRLGAEIYTQLLQDVPTVWVDRSVPVQGIPVVRSASEIACAAAVAFLRLGTWPDTPARAAERERWDRADRAGFQLWRPQVTRARQAAEEIGGDGTEGASEIYVLAGPIWDAALDPENPSLDRVRPDPEALGIALRVGGVAEGMAQVGYPHPMRDWLLLSDPQRTWDSWSHWAREVVIEKLGALRDRLGKKRIAFFALNDECAFGVESALRDLGVGFDQVAALAYDAAPPLPILGWSTLSQHPVRMGEEAVGLLCLRMGMGSLRLPAADSLIRPTLTLRASTALISGLGLDDPAEVEGRDAVAAEG